MINHQRECLVDGSDCGSTTCPKAELGDGEPSPSPQTPNESTDPAPHYRMFTDAISYHDALSEWVVRQFGKGEMGAGRLACVFDCVEFATKNWRSGAAQEVSSVGSVQTITGPERPRCPRCGAETTCLSCGQEVSPPSPEHCYCVCHSPTSSCPSCVHCCGDTRELKAALRMAVEWEADYRKINNLCGPKLHWVIEAERLLGETT